MGNRRCGGHYAGLGVDIICTSRVEDAVETIGEPIPELSGTFAQLAEQRGVSKVLLSLSYDGENAIAVTSLVSEKSH
jgi:phosphopantetheinyl transferase (holo-ACP synthase)